MVKARAQCGYFSRQGLGSMLRAQTRYFGPTRKVADVTHWQVGPGGPARRASELVGQGVQLGLWLMRLPGMIWPA